MKPCYLYLLIHEFNFNKKINGRIFDTQLYEPETMDDGQKAAEVFDRNAQAYEDKYMDTSLYHDTFDLFCDKIPVQNANILEIACGPGNITKYLLLKRPDFKIFGIDLAPKMIALARINNPSAEYALMDCREISKIDKKYDGIMCGFCLPYLSRAEAIQLISDASNLLTAHGILYLSTMEDDHSKSGLQQSGSGDEVYVNYHQEDYLTSALTSNGFDIICVQFKDFRNGNATATDLVIISAK